MKKYLLKRILSAIPVFFGITILAFCLIFLAPGDPVEMYYISRNMPLPPEEVLQEERHEAGLDRSLPVQYLDWLGKFVRGDMGTSYRDGISVNEKIKAALPNTLKLAAASFVFTFLLCIPLGLISAKYRDRIPDYIIRFLAFIFAAIPDFVMGIMLILLLTVKLKLLPIISFGSPKGLIMPVLSLSLAAVGKYSRQIRACVLEEMNREYVTSLRSRGITESLIFNRNILKNAMLTIITLAGIFLGYLMGGVTIIENLFVLPGVGKLVLDGVTNRDFPVVQGFVVWAALLYLTINIVTDVLYKFVDPRVDIGGDL